MWCGYSCLFLSMFGAHNKRIARKIIAILLLVVAEITLLSLGTWQLYRLSYKTSLIENISQQNKFPAIETISEPITYYRQVKPQGNLLKDKIIYIYSLNDKGEPGYDMIIPFKLKTDKVILVKYDWVKEKNYNEINSDITGMIIPVPRKNNFTPDNDVAKNIWYYVDIAQLEKFTNHKLLPGLIIRNAKSDDFKKYIRNDHLGYAIIWYSFAAILLIIIFIKRK